MTESDITKELQKTVQQSGELWRTISLISDACYNDPVAVEFDSIDEYVAAFEDEINNPNYDQLGDSITKNLFLFGLDFDNR